VRPDSHNQDRAQTDWETEVFWRLAVPRNNPIVAFNQNGSGLPFYCVHPIGGDVTFVAKLHRAIGDNQPLYGIQIPKANMRPGFAATIEMIASSHVQAIHAFQPAGPLIIGGWSTGAIIALEMVQQLLAAGRRVPLLVAFDGAPLNTCGGLSAWDPRYIWRLLCNVPHWLSDGQAETWSWRTFNKRIAANYAFRNQIRATNGGGEQTMNTSEVRKLLYNGGWSSGQLNFIQALWMAQQAYVPKRYSGEVLLYEAKIQPLLHLLQLSDAWKTVAQRVETIAVDGGHDSMFDEPAVGAIAEHLRTHLAKVGFNSDIAS
jgi:thioesterase domain-containing protein